MSLHCSGYGDLWDDIQNVQENDKDASVHGVSVSSEEAEGSKVASERKRKEECSDWKSEEEELGGEDDNAEDKDEDYKGTTRICVISDVHKAASSFKAMEGCSLRSGVTPGSCCPCRAQQKHPKNINTTLCDMIVHYFKHRHCSIFRISNTQLCRCYKYSRVCLFGVELIIVSFLSDWMLQRMLACRKHIRLYSV